MIFTEIRGYSTVCKCKGLFYTALVDCLEEKEVYHLLL